jgi:hypothetical protein
MRRHALGTTIEPDGTGMSGPRAGRRMKKVTAKPSTAIASGT